VEKSEVDEIKTEIRNITMSIDRILQKVAEYEKPTPAESEQTSEEIE
jgi:hypothetical protein